MEIFCILLFLVDRLAGLAIVQFTVSTIDAFRDYVGLLFILTGFLKMKSSLSTPNP